jgi:mono/diheme cytochrome c family protein
MIGMAVGGRRGALVGAMLLACVSQEVRAQEIGDAAAGRQLAERWCASCHVVTAKADSGTSNGAPTFVAIGRAKSTTYLSMRAFLQTPHDRMPDLHLSRDEVDDLTAYLLSLR